MDIDKIKLEKDGVMMLEKVKNKLDELEQQYDWWLDLYERDGLGYQRDKILMVGHQINILKDLLDGEE